ncbi:hypothetical protein CL629_04615 [bacterium]|nr:hypothetical protein [bacterium]
MQYINRFDLVIGDVFILYISLFLMLIIRYEPSSFSLRIQSHIVPFSLVFLVWLFVFLMNDLYKLRSLRMKKLFLRNLILAVSISFGLSILIFYLFGPFFSLTPKTNLILFGIISFVLLYVWRLFSIRLLSFGQVRVVFLGESGSLSRLLLYIKKNPQVGYRAESHIQDPSSASFRKMQNKKIDLIVLGPGIAHTSSLLSSLKLPSLSKISFVPFQDFYGSIFEKVSLQDVDEEWAQQLLSSRRRLYDFAKRIADFVLSVFLILIFSPIILLIWMLVSISSRGPAVYVQSRVGKGSKKFNLYKFRTMHHKSDGPLWTEDKDPRITPVGKILRFTHLDELPQLFNIARGDISFTGPRPERSELAEKYKELPYYDFRHLIKPGLTGWAQINYRASTSLKEAGEKLSYDLYYLRHRSFFIDVIVIIKTLKYVFFSS